MGGTVISSSVAGGAVGVYSVVGTARKWRSTYSPVLKTFKITKWASICLSVNEIKKHLISYRKERYNQNDYDRATLSYDIFNNVHLGNSYL